MASNLIPTPIVNKNGVATTVHKALPKPDSGKGTAGIPSPSLKKQMSQVDADRKIISNTIRSVLEGRDATLARKSLKSVSESTLRSLAEVISSSSESNQHAELFALSLTRLREPFVDSILKMLPKIDALREAKRYAGLRDDTNHLINSLHKAHTQAVSSYYPDEIFYPETPAFLSHFLDEGFKENHARDTFIECLANELDLKSASPLRSEKHKGMDALSYNFDKVMAALPIIFKANSSLVTMEDDGNPSVDRSGYLVKDSLTFSEAIEIAEYHHQDQGKATALVDAIVEQKRYDKEFAKEFMENGGATSLSKGVL